METVRVKADSSRLISALERTLPRHGYRTLRSFDLPLVAADLTAADPAQGTCECGEPCDCRYAVLLVYADRPGRTPPETLSIQGQGGSSFVTLLSPDGESALAARLALLLVEALQGADGTGPSDKTPAA